MSDSGFREIQLSGKHVVFLFIAGVVAAVAVFLLGVSVGRGVIRPDAVDQAAPTPAETMTDADQPAALPPPTTPAPGELQYHQTLQGKGDTTSVPPTSTPVPAVSPDPLVKPAAPSLTPVAKPAPASTPFASAGAVWFVQVSSFGSRDNASREVAQLKAKGIIASVFTERGSGTPFKVRVGPLERAAADAMVLRLRKEGFKPSPPIR